MARYVLIAAVAMALLAGCRGGGTLDVLRGNYAYSRGDYQGALVRYMAALDGGVGRGWIEYDTGNVYYALGEPEAALEAWFAARRHAGDERAGDTELVYAASYNRGVLLYELGQYEAAYDEFRYALTVKSGSIRAKANLELTLAKLRAVETAEESEGAAPPGEGDNGDVSEESLRILEYVRRKEAQQWFANREREEEAAPQDW